MSGYVKRVATSSPVLPHPKSLMRSSNGAFVRGSFLTGFCVHSKTWLIILAVLAFLAGAVALVVPLLAAILGLVAAAMALLLAFRSHKAEPQPESIAPASSAPESSSDRPTLAPTASPTSRAEAREVTGSASEAPEHDVQVAAVAATLPPVMSSPPPALGLASYERLEKLAQGTMGDLWLVRHLQLERTCALKEIRASDVDAEDVARFTREAQVLSKLHCPHTIKVYDFGVGQNGYPYYVMEHLNGINLQDLIERHGAMSASRTVHVLRQVCLSLDEAHQVGLVHRDIKPANIMLCRYGVSWDFAKLLDFGLVKREPGPAMMSLTRDSVVLGTPAYVAPESLKGSKFVDGRADLYALGAVGFFLLTGRLLFKHDQAVAMAKAHLSEAAPRASQWHQAPLPRELDDLLDDCLRKEPGKRPQTAAEVLRRLDEILEIEPWSQTDAQTWWAEHEHGLSPQRSG